ncbi:putative pantothenate metabolism flavoprotein [Flavimobilis marinus]|uniref:Coenzyme A biosynthesis bifunctional protein CoaBC n=1 Tax=Flavimobilis marinus TaxID=285351 RepID=A0A1I2FE19_9MICO|nr:bifunctional phosphopantothenoylcysteine decarboxylase/phosphopantothenate--cysteine ligase CoaBC [Flavimobilis marinus]GHG52350.1 putative pantothenate metabolism flavoprotein [Flavimobilis marinus]SFF03129.1 phosphopantothenoylcysteine decarboxylase / phosphopantothenate--cysteine ligase [Flavimobilis marinus]
MRIILGVSAGIAAYKAAILLRLLREAGHAVRVVPTESSYAFVGRATWEALSGEPATHEVFDAVPEVAHVRLGQGADLVIVAPATADVLAKAATGRADDLLTTTLLTVRCPVLVAPAMHTEMWLHAATQANVATLRARGVHVLEPATGRLTGADSGPGRLPEPQEIAAAALALVNGRADDAGVPRGDFSGRRVVVSAGGTLEPLDPVRFLGNRSTGRQGIAIAEAAAARGAAVTLVAANVHLEVPAGIDVVRVETAAELDAAMTALAPETDVVVMAAAVADFRPVRTADSKIKKAPGGAAPLIELVENPDVLAGLAAQRRAGQVVVGFAAETGDEHASVVDHGRAKARRKGADLMAINDVSAGRGFGSPDNAVVVVNQEGAVVAEATGSKREVADAILDAVVPLLDAPDARAATADA